MIDDRVLSGRRQPAGATPSLPTLAEGITVLVLLLLIAVFFLPPGSAVEEAKDFLDSFMGWYAVRGRQQGFFFDYQHIVPDVVGGVPLNVFPFGDLNVGIALFNLFDPFTAYAVNQAVIHLLAYAGMYLLVRDHVLSGDPHARTYAAITALCFAVIPHQFWMLGTAVALPLAAWGYIRVWRQGPDFAGVLAVLFYPFYSMAVYGALQMYGVAFLVTAAAFFFNRQQFRSLLWVTAALLVLFVVVESRLFYHWLFATYDYFSNRSVEPRGAGTRGVGFEFITHLLFGWETPFQAFQHPLVVPVVAAAMLASGLKRWLGREQDARMRRFLWILLALLLVSVVTSAFIAFDRKYYFGQLVLGIPFSFSRSDAAQPAIGWSCFALSLAILASLGRLARRIAVPAVVALVAAHTTLQFQGFKYEIKDALGLPQRSGLRSVAAASVTRALGIPGLAPESFLARIWGMAIVPRDDKFPLGTEGPLVAFRRYGEYRLEDYYESAAMPALKSALAARLGQAEGARILTVNLSSTVALVNGFRTPNAYMADYPAGAGKAFLDLFAGEYAKDGLPTPPPSSNYLEAYVSRSSLAPDGLSIDLALDAPAVRDLRIDAIFSYLDIRNAQSLGLASLGRFGHIHAYLVLPSA